eukprot:1157724-Pelagomonas_calceolata.AAC.7
MASVTPLQHTLGWTGHDRVTAQQTQGHSLTNSGSQPDKLRVTARQTQGHSPTNSGSQSDKLTAEEDCIKGLGCQGGSKVACDGSPSLDLSLSNSLTGLSELESTKERPSWRQLIRKKSFLPAGASPPFF